MKTNQLKIEFFCGTTFDRNGDLIEPSACEAARRTAQGLLLAAFGGYSQLTVIRAWRSPATGQTAHDVTIVYTCLSSNGDDFSALDELQDRLKVAFNQESVPYVVTSVFCKF